MATILHNNSNTWVGDERRVVSPNYLDTNLMQTGLTFARYSLAAIFIWVGLLKFTAYEAKNIEPMLTNSPIWTSAYDSIGLFNLSSLIGVIEIAIGVLIAVRAFAPRLTVIGGLGAIISFIITLSFMFTTPGVWEPGYGFPSLSALPGQFLAKDLVMLGVSIWITGEALNAVRMLSPRKFGVITGT